MKIRQRGDWRESGDGNKNESENGTWLLSSISVVWFLVTESGIAWDIGYPDLQSSFRLHNLFCLWNPLVTWCSGVSISIQPVQTVQATSPTLTGCQHSTVWSWTGAGFRCIHRASALCVTSTSNELGVLEVVVPGVGDNHHLLSSGTCAPMYGCDAAVSAKVSIAPNQVFCRARD